MSRKLTADVLACAGGLSVGCCLDDGTLVPTESAYRYEGSVPASVIFAGYAQGAGRYFLCTADAAYVSGNGNSFVFLENTQCVSPFLVEDIKDGVPRAVLICGKSALTHTGSAYSGFNYGADLRCGIMHCGRLFGIDVADGYKLRWSGPGGIDDWTGSLEGSGSAVLDPGRGEVLQLAEFGDKLIAVRKYGLTVMNAFGTPENFSADITDTDTDEIYGGTARSARGNLYFVTASGLKYFDGARVRGVAGVRADDIVPPVCAAACAGRYYVACGERVLCYDTERGQSYFIAIGADAMCAARGGMRVYNGRGAFRLESGGSFVYTSGKLDFGNDGSKTVTGLFIDSDGVDVEISNGRVSRRFLSARGTVRPDLRGKSFTVKVSGKNTVRGITAEAEAMNVI